MSGESNEPTEPFTMKLEHLVLEREHTCLRQLTWRCTLQHGDVNIDEVLGGLQRVGFSDRSTLPGLRVMEHPERHTIAVVEKTQRIQIKVHYTVEEEHRIQTAVVLARQLDKTLSGIS